MIVAKAVEWEMGHRIPSHGGKCRNLHGHHYRAEVMFEGVPSTKSGDAAEGMVADFGDIRRLTTEHVRKPLDHAFMVWDQDKILNAFFNQHKELKAVKVPFTTTAENIARWIYAELEPHCSKSLGPAARLHSVKVWETPGSYALYDGNDDE